MRTMIALVGAVACLSACQPNSSTQTATQEPNTATVTKTVVESKINEGSTFSFEVPVATEVVIKEVSKLKKETLKTCKTKSSTRYLRSIKNKIWH